MGRKHVALVLNYAKANGSEQIIDAFLPNAQKENGYLKLANIHGDPGNSLFGKLDGYRFKDGATGEAVDIIELVQKSNVLPSYEEAAQAIEHSLQLEDQAAESNKPDNTKRKLEEKPVACVVPPLELFKQALSSFEIGKINKKGRTLKAVHVYHTAENQPFFLKMREEWTGADGQRKKSFSQAGWFGDPPSFAFKGMGLVKEPPYNLPAIVLDTSKTILAVEGEKTADAARQLFPDMAVASPLGGSSGVRKMDLSAFAGRHVIIAPDNDAPGQKMADQLAARLLSEGAASVKICDVSMLPPGGDFADPPPDGVDYRELVANAQTAETLAQGLLTLTIEELVKRIVYIGQLQIFVDIETGRRFELPDFDNLFRHVDGSARRQLLGNVRLRKAPAGIVYLPLGDRPLAKDQDGLDAYNSYLPTELKPQKGNAFPFVRLVRRLCGTRAEAVYLLGWLAHLVQNPNRKMRVAIVIHGKQGTGKNTLGYIMRDVIGRSNFTIITTQQIKAQFNAYMDSKLLIVIDEAMDFGQLEMGNKLKDLITEPWVTINDKHKREYTIQNFANFMYLTNYTNALKLPSDDRRHFVISSQRNRPSKEYFTAFNQWLETNKGVILDYLRRYDLSGFDPNEPAEWTAGKATMVEMSRDPIEEEIDALIQNSEAPFDHDLFVLKDAHRDLSSGGIISTHITERKLTALLGKLGAVKLGQKGATIDGKYIRKSLWACRNTEKYFGIPDRDLILRYLDQEQGRSPLPF